MTMITTRIRVWDLPTRIFHWALACCAVAAFITVKLGGLWMDWHIRLGLATLGLIVFRVIWGLAGPRYARFSHFVRGPRTLLHYLRGKSGHMAGHSPLGAYSVIALLLVFGFQAFSGLFANDDVLSAGPLAFLNEAWSATFTGLHKLNEWILIALVALHISAILWYRFKSQKDLIGPMIHGDAHMAPQAGRSIQGARDSWQVRLAALALAATIAVGVWWLTTLAPTAESFY